MILERLDGAFGRVNMVVVWFDGRLGFPVCIVPLAWVLAYKGMASDNGSVLYAALAFSKNSLRRLSNASCWSWSSIWEVLPAEPTIGRVHRSVAGSFTPVKIIFPLYLTMHFLISNLTMHPAAVRTRILNREAIDNSGTICPTSVVGRPTIIISHICVDINRRPSANATFSGHIMFACCGRVCCP